MNADAPSFVPTGNNNNKPKTTENNNRNKNKNKNNNRRQHGKNTRLSTLYIYTKLYYFRKKKTKQ